MKLPLFLALFLPLVVLGLGLDMWIITVGVGVAYHDGLLARPLSFWTSLPFALLLSVVQTSASAGNHARSK